MSGNDRCDGSYRGSRTFRPIQMALWRVIGHLSRCGLVRSVTKRVFSVCGTSTRVLALHEHLPLGGGGPGEPFVHMVESPYEDFNDDFTRLRECEITLGRGRSIATWCVDGHLVYMVHGALIPAGARIAFGIYTQLPIRAGRSQSLEGQGLSALWRRPRTRGVER